MTTPIVVTKSTKSVGIAILLTFLFGPIGLFYASVIGGLIMTFTPIFLALLALIGLAQENLFLFGWSFGLLIIFAVTFWLVNIIWAVISVINYNREIEDDARRQFALWNSYNQSNPNQLVVNINQKTSDLIYSERQTIEISTKPNLQDWLRSNPGKTINDYFTKFGR
jgi:ABC-type multidrug transport system fused ATPase/permease subunit